MSPGPEKSSLTFVGCFRADGKIICPGLIYPYSRIPREIADRIPAEFFAGRSDSGWMQAANFLEFIANLFLPLLKKERVKMPVILFVDGHSSHMSLQVSKFCEDNQIFLYLLPPNTTHILQPADVGPFRPLKLYWRKQVRNFQRENPNSTVRRADVAPLLKKVLENVTSDSIRNGFRATGLFPLDENRPDYSKCVELPTAVDDIQMQTQSLSDKQRTSNCEIPVPTNAKYHHALDVFEEEIGATNIGRLLRNDNVPQEIFADFYRKLVRKTQPKETSTPPAGTSTGGSTSTACRRLFDDGAGPSRLVASSPSSPTLVLNSESSLESLFEGFPPTQDPTDRDNGDPDNGIDNSANVNANSTISDKGNSVNNYVFYSGVTICKKTKTPKKPICSMISSVEYRKNVLNSKSKIKNSKKSNSDEDWKCIFCGKLYSSDYNHDNICTWIACDKCNRTMHVKCCSETHLTKMGLTLDDSDRKSVV